MKVTGSIVHKVINLNIIALKLLFCHYFQKSVAYVTAVKTLPIFLMVFWRHNNTYQVEVNSNQLDQLLEF